MATHTRERHGSVDIHESRPITRDRKKLSLFQRLTSKRRSAVHQQAHRHTHNNTTTTAMVAETSAIFSTSVVVVGTTTRTVSATSSPVHRNRHMTYTSPSTCTNVMDWLHSENCPKEILPHVLSYAGPQTAAALSKTNRFWSNVMKDEATWRVLCEELYKWKQGDAIPESWRDFYKYNPCVPVDYSTIHAALGVVNMAARNSNNSSIPSNMVRVLLRPARYILREAITIDTEHDGDGATAPIHVELATQEYFPEIFHPSAAEAARNASSSPSEPQPSKKRKKTLRNLLSCRSVDVAEEQEPAAMVEHPFGMDMDVAVHGGGIPPEMLLENHPLGGGGGITSTTTTSSSPTSSHSNAKVHRASLVLRTRRHNEPLLRIRQGSCTVRNIELKHICHGTDIWNGNAAVQLQPPMGPDDQPLLVNPAPTATLDRVEIVSASGRGIVNIDGGLINVTNCYVHDCAATGIYVGGPGSRANIVRSDVVANGNGNSQHRRGIARGHSGIYLEQGHASIVDCNVSQNSLTGISAVSPENAVLNLEESDLVSNGTYQLEMPAAGTVAHRNSNTSNNNLATTGLARSRSGLVMES